MTPALNDFIGTYNKRIERQLTNVLPQRVPGSERLAEAMAYSLLSGGKRIRPILVYASARAIIGAETPAAVDAAASAVECIHAYSLIHDDLPAMDDDDLRRGLPTCHIAYDEATAVLAGDALQCLAFETLANCATHPTTAVALIRELGRCSGALGMVAGQAIDMAAVNTAPSLQQLELMHNHKTGALIEAAILMGAIATGENVAAVMTPLHRYAKAIGLSFQVQDDILDVEADTQTLGKRQGSDAHRHKPTYVTHLGLAGAREKAASLHQQALTALEDFDHKADMLREISAYIIARTH